ncbi:MAG: patatin-like phospholipase family protein [Candidatus Omnitrophota bacterium]|nr:patatin-like phospholipase family protein [Candidatus Omnitrophota bacterium]
MNLKNRLLNIFKRKKIALVLGGGSARGIAHIGVLKVFQKEEIKFDFVVGTSIGALIGAFYALGEDMAKAEEMALGFKVRESMDVVFPPAMGLIKGARIYGVIERLVGKKKFSDLKIPMAAVTTDIETGEEVVFSEGPLAGAIMASCSYPGIVTPQRVNGRLLVDGGIINTVPVSVARRMGADIVVAVDVGFCVQVGHVSSIFKVILQAFQITGDALSRYQSMHADIIIRPDLGDIDQLAFASANIAMQKGELAALEKLREIKKKTKTK